MKNQIQTTKILNGHIFQVTTPNSFFPNGKKVGKDLFLQRLSQEQGAA